MFLQFAVFIITYHVWIDGIGEKGKEMISKERK